MSPQYPPTQICYLETPSDLEQSFSITFMKNRWGWGKRDVEASAFNDGRAIGSALICEGREMVRYTWDKTYQRIDGETIESELRFTKVDTKEDDDLPNEAKLLLPDLGTIRIEFVPGVIGRDLPPRSVSPTPDAVDKVPEHLKKATLDRMITSVPSKIAEKVGITNFIPNETKRVAQKVVFRYMSRGMLTAQGIIKGIEPERVDPSSHVEVKTEGDTSELGEVLRELKDLRREVTKLKAMRPHQDAYRRKFLAGATDIIDLTSD